MYLLHVQNDGKFHKERRVSLFAYVDKIVFFMIYGCVFLMFMYMFLCHFAVSAFFCAFFSMVFLVRMSGKLKNNSADFI